MKDKPKVEINRKPIVKFVRKAGRWHRTSWKDGKQIQEWFDKNPNG